MAASRVVPAEMGSTNTMSALPSPRWGWASAVLEIFTVIAGRRARSCSVRTPLSGARPSMLTPPDPGGVVVPGEPGEPGKALSNVQAGMTASTSTPISAGVTAVRFGRPVVGVPPCTRPMTTQCPAQPITSGNQVGESR